MALKNLRLPGGDMVYRPAHPHPRQPASPMRAPPSAFSRTISRSAESLVASSRNGQSYTRSRKARSTEQPGGGGGGGGGVHALPALVRPAAAAAAGSHRDDDSFRSSSRNGSGSSLAGSVERSLRGSDTTLQPDEDNINVVVRVRPLNDKERASGEKEILEFPGNGQVVCQPSGVGQRAKLFSYNVVFEPAASQDDVLEYSGVKRLLEMAVEGFSCTAFCYGQTGSGKTHTLTGPPGLVESGVGPHAPQHGLVVRAFVQLFSLLRARPDYHFVLKASFLEIYNEKVIDLLNPGSARKPLQVRWSKESRGFYVENLFTVDCEELDDLFAVLEEGYGQRLFMDFTNSLNASVCQIMVRSDARVRTLKKGMRNRAVGTHAMNAHSSRSHTILSVRVSRDLNTDGAGAGRVSCSTHGKINFVDLAGSEMTKRTNSRGKTLEEANNINRSLMVLGYCIASLSDNKRKGHIPYRDSKLTKLLADSLAGNGVTLMIACIAPSRSNVSETLNTLRYAARAKKIKTKPVVKMDARDALIMSLKREVDALQQENRHLRAALHVRTELPSYEKRTSRTPPHVEPSKLMELESAELVQLVKLYMEENAALRTENSELFCARDALLRDQELVCRENERLLKKLEDVNSVCCRSPIIPARPAYGEHPPPADYTAAANIWTNPHHSSANSVVSGDS